MLLNHIAEIAGVKKKIMAGCELGRSYAQISYIGPGMDKPESAAVVTGKEMYNIPTVLCKRVGVNQWYYGRSAAKMNESESVIRVDHLLDKARRGDQVEVDGERYDPSALLALFIKRSLSILAPICGTSDIASIMFTVESLDDRMIGILTGISKNIGLEKTNIYFQDYAESIFHYMMYQPQELWRYEVMACLYDGERAHIYKMDRNTDKTPVVVIINEDLAEGLMLPKSNRADTAGGTTAENTDAAGSAVNGSTNAAGGTAAGETDTSGISSEIRESLDLLDARFARLFERECSGNHQSCVYLLGEGFKEEWMKKSLKVLCSDGRRVFQGNNLFSIGACYCLMDMKKPCAETAAHLYLGRDKLKVNVGINVFRQGREECFSVFDAGTTWYDAQKEIECIMGDDQTISIMITPMDGQKIHTEVLTLRDIPERPPKTTRIHILFTMVSLEKINITIEDMGFGEMYPSSGQKQEFEIDLDH